MALSLPSSPDSIELHLPLDASDLARGLKRKRPSPLTPPVSIDDAVSAHLLDRAVHVLSTEATALSHITRLYQTDPAARDALLKAVDIITRVNEDGAKMVICGVGKSGHVGRKIEATMKSLSLACSFMHAAEAIHGDLGDVRPDDALMFITYSGRTPELMNVIKHIADDVPIIVLTSHMELSACPLVANRSNCVLLPAPIHEKEETSFGVSAPTTSTTVAMAVGDMLSITTAERMHEDRVKNTFHKNHPGGAIGADVTAKKQKSPGWENRNVPLVERKFSIPIHEITTVQPSMAGESVTALDIHHAAANSPHGWVWVTPSARIMRPRDVKKLRSDDQIYELSHAFATEELPEVASKSSLTSTMCTLHASGNAAAKVLKLRDEKNWNVCAVVDVEELGEYHSLH